MKPDDPRHGTTAGYQAHLTAGVKMCDPCAKAARAYRTKHRRPFEPCRSCAKPCQSRSGLCIACRPRSEEDRRVRPCTQCGAKTKAKSGMCATCRPERAKPTARRKPRPTELAESDLLLDGWWVSDGRTQRWVAATDEDYRRWARGAA